MALPQERLLVPNLHVHGLQRSDPRIIHAATGGSWYCDSCPAPQRLRGPGEWPWHCSAGCDYDSCDSCARLHVQWNGSHAHAITIADPLVAHAAHHGHWICDVCGIADAIGHMRHCTRGCDFDMCAVCAEQCVRIPQEKRVRTHAHALVVRDSSTVFPDSQGTWTCDGCQHLMSWFAGRMWHCHQRCNYTLCDECVDAEAIGLQLMPADLANPCVQCHIAEANIVNVPCGCTFLCEECNQNFRAANGPICNSCRRQSDTQVLVRKRSCDVCLEEHSLQAISVLAECGHLICVGCMVQLIRTAIGDATQFPLRCAIPNCNQTVSRHEVKRLQDLSVQLDIPAGSPLTDEDFARFDRMANIAAIPAHSRIDCPRPDCGGTLIHDGPCEEGADMKVICPHCMQYFCFACRDPWHQDQTCAQHIAQRERIEAGMHKQCPVCALPVTHYLGNGCHHICPGRGCPGCGTHWCYVCLAHPYQYGHMKPDGTPCPVFCDATCGCPVCPRCNGAGCDECRT